tara:strand:+ start:637 stop:810 length:174 start_codon:yes stop_codon:yes gene_type:complete
LPGGIVLLLCAVLAVDDEVERAEEEMGIDISPFSIASKWGRTLSSKVLRRCSAADAL